MAAVSIQITPRGIQSTVVEQEFVFFIGPSPENTLSHIVDCDRRSEDVRPFTVETHPQNTALRAAVSGTYGILIKSLVVTLSQGGKRGLSCPNLVIDLVASKTENGESLFEISNPHNGAALCRELIDLLNADWVDVWWMGTLGNAQINCDRNGKAIWFHGNGKKEEL